MERREIAAMQSLHKALAIKHSVKDILLSSLTKVLDRFRIDSYWSHVCNTNLCNKRHAGDQKERVLALQTLVKDYIYLVI